ncbi:MAG: hypothetical protein JWN27_2766 [Candidatus Eremiobacteraeota bacterium]|nr:hypothetical protein [Candidatus Eremiobacteraeota bacterium]
MRLRRLGFVCALSASILAACGTNNNLLGTSTTTQSAIRFINGSPDLNASGVDIYIAGTSGTASATALTYGTVTPLAIVNSQAYTVTVTPTGNKATTSLSCATPSLAANTRYTIVIAGKANPGSTAGDGLQCQIFAETIFSLPTGSFQLAFHNASPALNASQPNGAGFGVVGLSSPPVYNNFAGPLATFTAPTSGVANGVAVNVLPAGVLTAPGMGVYVANSSPNPPPSVLATLLPSALQVGFTAAVTATNPPCPDSGNLFPIQTPSPTPSPASTTAPTPSPTPVPVCLVTSNVMSVYAIDAPTGSAAVTKLVGVTD